MPKLLLPVDGSEYALRAVEYVVRLSREMPGVECFLLNVQEPFENKLHAVLSSDEIHTIQHEEAEQALQSARTALDAAGVPYRAFWVVGVPVTAIVESAREHHCDGIVIGLSGVGFAIGPLMMGSTTVKVIHASPIPVTVAK